MHAATNLSCIVRADLCAVVAGDCRDEHVVGQDALSAVAVISAVEADITALRVVGVAEGCTRLDVHGIAEVRILKCMRSARREVVGVAA